MKTLLWIILLIGLLMLGIFAYDRLFGDGWQATQSSSTEKAATESAAPAETENAPEAEPPKPKTVPAKGTVTGIYSGSKTKIKNIYSTHDAAVEKAAE